MAVASVTARFSITIWRKPQDKWYKGTIQATAIELQQVGDSLHIQVLYDLDKIKVQFQSFDRTDTGIDCCKPPTGVTGDLLSKGIVISKT